MTTGSYRVPATSVGVRRCPLSGKEKYLTHRSPFATRLGSPRTRGLLLVLVAAGFGVCSLVANYRVGREVKQLDRRATRQALRPRVEELVGLIPARHHTGPMAFSPDGKTLVLPNRADGRVYLVKFKGAESQVFACSMNAGGAAASRIALSGDGRLLAAYYNDAGACIWDLSEGREQSQILIRQPSWISHMAFSDGGRTLVTLLATTPEPDPKGILRKCSAVTWDALTGRKRETRAFDTARNFIGISRNGRYAILEDGKITVVFDLTMGKQAFAIDFNRGLCLSEDASMLVSYEGSQVRVWEVPSGRELKRFEFNTSFLIPGYERTDRLAISHDSKLLAVGWFTETNMIGIISLASGKVLDVIECGPAGMFCDTILFSPDRRILVTDTESTNVKDADVEPILKFWQIPASW